jgi:hypothetical protein
VVGLNGLKRLPPTNFEPEPVNVGAYPLSMTRAATSSVDSKMH